MAIDIAGQQILAQPVSSFLQGRALRQAEEQGERKMKALEAAESREAEAFELQKQDRQVKYDEIAGKKALAGAQQVLAVPKGQRKAFVEQNFADVISGLEQQGYGTWNEIDEDELEELATGIQARAMTDLGMSPMKAEEYTLKPGEKRMRGDKVVAESVVAEKDEWTKPEPVMIGGRKVMAQVNMRTGEPRVVPGATPIENGGADPTDKSFTRANVLRDEFNAANKDFSQIQAQYNNIVATAREPSAAGDISLIFSYMKMLDPASTVREGEFATAQNASGVPDKVLNAYNKAIDGKLLGDEASKLRADFVKQARNIYNIRREQAAKVRKRYKDLAERAKVDPLDVIGADEQEADETPSNGHSVTATGPNGQKLILRNGRWEPFSG